MCPATRMVGGGGGGVVISSVREPALFGAAPALEVRGPGADSGSDQSGSSPAPGKKAAPAPYTNIFHFEL